MNTETQDSKPDGRRFPRSATSMSVGFAAMTDRTDEPSTQVAGQRDRSMGSTVSGLPPLDWPPNLFA